MPPPAAGSDLGIEVASMGADPGVMSAVRFLREYTDVFIAAFLVTLLVTPIVRRLAIRWNVVDHPDEQHKTHRIPVAYLGGVAVFLGLIVAIALSYAAGPEMGVGYRSVPIAVVIGMIAILLTGLADDVWGWDPRLKIAGQLVAAAALAIDEVGVRVATGVLAPVFGLADEVTTIGGLEIVNGEMYYWLGTALIAVFVLGGCNAANLIDGLDGLLSGVVGIAALGLLVICLLMVPQGVEHAAEGKMPLTAASIVLSLALLGSTLGFLPHNFKPAAIFLGDCGSLLLGYMVVVIILMIGERGQTHLVFAGLIVFAIPIMDTTLAMIRRKLAGTPMSAADDQHLHHQLRRALGSVHRAVLALYGLAALFAIVGISMAALVLQAGISVRIVYAIALVLFGFVGAVAVKVARRQQILQAVRSRPARLETTTTATAAGSESTGSPPKTDAKTTPPRKDDGAPARDSAASPE
ncbi:MAG: glycosyltransferase family 4 protein [Planctomycetota bacterium]